jgi:iron complex outermembrane receptor protein
VQRSTSIDEILAAFRDDDFHGAGAPVSGFMTLPHPQARAIAAVCRGAGLFFFASVVSCSAFAAAAPSPTLSSSPQVSYLKRLSLEELLAMDVTTVSRRPQHLSSTASAITVLTGDDIRRSGATTFADALRFSSGLEVARIDGRTWGVASRGFNLTSSNKLLVMLDGRSLYTPLFSGVFWDVQDTEFADIDRVEVVRGPGGTMWGANAVNGVISIHTKPAQETIGTLVSAGGGDEERAFASFRHGLQLADGIYGRVYAKQYHRDDLALSNGADANDDARMWQAGFRIDGARASDPNAWTVQGDIYHGFLGAIAGPDSRVAGGNVLGRWEHSFDPGRALTLQAYYDRVERFVPGQFREWRNNVDVDLQFNTAIGTRQQLVTGLNARSSNDQTSSKGTARFSPRDRRMTVFGGFVHDEIQLIHQTLALTMGAKFEHNDSTGFEFQPSVGAAWRPDNIQTVWARVSRAVRTPSRFDDDLQFVLPTGGTFVRGDPAFESEKLIAFEAGYRIHLRQNWAIDLTLFENRYDDLRSQERATEPGVFFVLQNRLNAETRGGEVAITTQLTEHWRLRAMYAHLRKRLDFDPGSTDLTGGSQEGNDPKNHWTLVSSWDLPRRWEFDASLRRVDPLTIPYVPGYTELDVHLGWQPAPTWELALVGQNLLHRRHREFGAAGPIARELERGIYAKATWRF